MPFITAYEKDSGRKGRGPAHFFDVPSLHRGLLKNPPRKERQDSGRNSRSVTENAPASGEKE